MPQWDPTLSTFYRYWEARCGSRAVPRRSDIDPSDIRALLRNLQLVDVIDRGERFRFRLVGTAIVTAYARGSLSDYAAGHGYFIFVSTGIGNAPLYLGHPEFEGFEVVQTIK
ncbi:MAG: hypothetical protein JWL84_4904 [Rhodospirillales bacterium]|jgi:hypothetical protein|nr:hypothetical protein [Rhodospirillales bacterium]